MKIQRSTRKSQFHLIHKLPSSDTERNKLTHQTNSRFLADKSREKDKKSEKGRIGVHTQKGNLQISEP